MKFCQKPIFTLLALLICLSTYAQNPKGAISVSPTLPQVGKQLTLTYDMGKSVVNAKNPQLQIFVFKDDASFYVLEPDLKIEQPTSANGIDKFKASFTVPLDAVAINFNVANSKISDNNAGKGYFYKVVDSKKIPLKAANYVATIFYGEGFYDTELARDFTLAKAELAKAIKADPAYAQKPRLKAIQWSMAMDSNEALAKKAIEKEIKTLNKKQNKTENDFELLRYAHLYTLGRAAGDSVQKLEAATFPKSDAAKEVALKQLARLKDADSIVGGYKIIRANFDVDDSKDARLIQAALQPAAKSYFESSNMAAFDSTLALMPEQAKYNFLNSMAWKKFRENKRLEDAKSMAYTATNWAEMELLNPKPKKDNTTTLAWIDNRDYYYMTYADTYASILAKLGDTAQALSYQRRATGSKKFLTPDINDSYLMYVAKVQDADYALEQAEKVVESGVYGDTSLVILKTLYAANNKPAADFDNYLTGLKATARLKLKDDLAAKMMNLKAPAFAVKNLEGKLVNKNNFIGKTTIVDFWALWCGPCMASMPGMKKAQQKFADNPKVQFYFVNTWEGKSLPAEKGEKVKKFLKEKNYPFDVLMDVDDKMVKAYGVSGIPTKFVVDEKGNIRFSTSGGSEDDVSEEISLMIELAQQYSK